jgi:hypothetical protein
MTAFQLWVSIVVARDPNDVGKDDDAAVPDRFKSTCAAGMVSMQCYGLWS